MGELFPESGGAFDTGTEFVGSLSGTYFSEEHLLSGDNLFDKATEHPAEMTEDEIEELRAEVPELFHPGEDVH